MTDHVLFERAFTIYNQVFSCKQFGDFFSTDERCLFFIHKKTPNSCQAYLNFIGWWLSMSHLNELLQVTTRSSAVSNSVNFSRQMRGGRSSSLPKKPRQLSSIFEFHWLLIDHVLFEFGGTSYNQVNSCKQCGDFFSTDEGFVLHSFTIKSWQLSSIFEFHWLMTEHVSFEWAFTS